MRFLWERFKARRYVFFVYLYLTHSFCYNVCMKDFCGKWILRLVLIICGLLALWMLISRFRVPHLGFMYDEVYSWATANPAHAWGIVWQEVLLQDVNLPLFNIFLRGWAHVLPPTLPWMRLFSALCSFLTIPAAWYLAPHSWSRLQKGIFCLLLAASCPLTQYASVLRCYSLGVLLCVIFTLLALQIAQGIIHRQSVAYWKWGLFWLAGLCAAYTHYFATALFFITSLFLFLVACIYKQNRVWIVGSTAVALCLWFPWLWHVEKLLTNPQSAWWIHTSSTLASWQILEFVFGNIYVAAGIIAFLIVGFISFLFNRIKWQEEGLPAGLALFQILILVGVVSFISAQHNLWLERYFVFLVPSLCLLLTCLLMHLGHRWSGWWIVLALIVGSNAWIYEEKYALSPKDVSGLEEAFRYVHEMGYDRVLVLYDRVTYPPAVSKWVLEYFIPKDISLELITLTPENATRMQKPEGLALVAPLGSFSVLMEASQRYHFDIDSPRAVFKQTSVLIDPQVANQFMFVVDLPSHAFGAPLVGMVDRVGIDCG